MWLQDQKQRLELELEEYFDRWKKKKKNYNNKKNLSESRSQKGFSERKSLYLEQNINLNNV